MNDLENNYKHIIGGLLIAILFSLTYILLLRWFSWIMVWMSLWAFVGLLGFGESQIYSVHNSLFHSVLYNTWIIQILLKYSNMSYMNNFEKKYLDNVFKSKT